MAEQRMMMMIYWFLLEVVRSRDLSIIN